MTLITAAMEAYDNATNPNKTRGGLKRSNEMLVGLELFGSV